MFKLIQGDCLEVMPKLIEDGIKADLVLTDPPYGIDVTPRRKTSKFYGKKVKNDDNLDWLPYWVECIDKISKNIVVVFTSWVTFSQFEQAFKEQGFTLKNLLVWNKMWIGVGHNYRPTYELIMLLCKSNFKTPSNNKGNILNYRKIAPQKTLHNCEKPTPLLEDLLVELSEEDDVVLDCFMGSGSTAIACKNTNRQFIGIELDKDYYQIAQERCKNYQTKLEV